MAQPYVGEIRIFAGNFPPAGWAFCEGQLIPISENETLYQLIGTTYGGDGESTFALPNLRARIPTHFGSSMPQASAAGVEEVTITFQQMPQHTHPFMGTVNSGTQNVATNMVVAQSPTQNAFPYGTDVPTANFNGAVVGPIGGSQPHTNLQPYLCLHYIISLFGLFPSPT